MSRVPSTISALKKLARQRPGLVDVIAKRDYIPEAEDRVAAIIETTSVEDALEDAILHKMVGLNNTEYSELFVGDMPLGNYGAKIKLGYALGIFGRRTRKDLDTIRWIRNAFAHSGKLLSFSTKEVADSCNLLTVVDRTPNLADFKGLRRPINTPRNKFLASTALLGGALTRVHWPELYERSPESAPLD